MAISCYFCVSNAYADNKKYHELYNRCEIALKYLDTAEGGENAAVSTGYCFGYFGGFGDMYRAHRDQVKDSCKRAPTDKNIDLARMFIGAVDDAKSAGHKNPYSYGFLMLMRATCEGAK